MKLPDRCWVNVRFWAIAVLALTSLARVGEPQPVVAAGAAYLGNGLGAVSCASATFCVAVGSNSPIWQYDGSAWTFQPQDYFYNGKEDYELTGVACPSAVFCVAVGGGPVLVYNGISWTPQSLFIHASPSSVACTGPSFCVVVDPSGEAFSYNGADWLSVGTVTSATLYGVACAGTTFCVAVGMGGTILTYNGTSWSSVASPTTATLRGVSCASTAFCVAVGSSNSPLSSGGFTTVGTVVTYNGVGWNTQPDPATAGLSDVSCPTAAFCVAMDGNAVLTYNGSVWSSQLNSPLGLGGVSCVSPTFCVAVGGFVSIMEYNGTSWTTMLSGMPTEYSAGWNLVGEPTGTVISGNIGPVYTYGTGDTAYEIVPNGTPLQAGKGYWAYFNAPAFGLAPFTTDSNTRISIPPSQWVLLANPLRELAVISGADAAYAYNPDTGSYTQIGQGSELGVDQGFWAYSGGGGAVTLSPGPPIP